MSFAKEQAIVTSIITRLGQIRQGADIGNGDGTKFQTTLALVLEGMFADDDLQRMTETPCVFVRTDQAIRMGNFHEQGYDATMPVFLEVVIVDPGKPRGRNVDLMRRLRLVCGDIDDALHVPAVVKSVTAPDVNLVFRTMQFLEIENTQIGAAVMQYDALYVHKSRAA